MAAVRRQIRRASALLLWTLPALTGIAACGSAERPPHSGPPHIVLIVVDDLGWADVGYHGASVPTPHIDSLAREGVELDAFYVTPICSATRAALLTGRYPIRYGLARANLAPWRNFGLDTEEVTLADVLAEQGYAHRAIFGKWHLGHLDRRWHPLQRGFTRFQGHYNGAIDYFTHERDGERDWHLDYEPLREEGYATDLIADAASRYIAEHAGEGPLLCYVAFNAPHAPFQARDAALERARALANPDGSVSLAQTRSAMIASLDDGIGRILAALEQAGIADDTLVWFHSDNGAGPETPESNKPLRGYKLTLFEGGVRVPSAVRWPRGLPGGVRCAAPLAAIDVLPTLMQVAGIEIHGGKPLDGLGVLDVLRGKSAAPERDLYFHYGQDGPMHELVALRNSRWKLIVSGPDLANHAVGDQHERLLFDLAEDSQETRDVGHQNVAMVEELTLRLAEFRRLQPEHSIDFYWEGSEGFEAPRDWRIPPAR